MMKYSEPKTVSFAGVINKTPCLKDLNQLIVNEGCPETMPVFVNNEVVIDMDCVEHKTASEEKRISNKSMDSSFVVSNPSGVRDTIILVEFRFNYANLKNLDKYSLLGKVSGSTSVLKNPTNLHRKYIYIFNPNLKNQAIRRFRNMVPTMPLNYVAIDIFDLKSSYF